MKIRVLDAETVQKIAAGEVIERPASVVKELAENAVDAGARTIIIEVFKGGLERITVSDDGHGMEPQDLALAVDRHATSKISSSADLFDINTLGFRGEALASIGAVAELTVVSRTRDRWEGSRIVVRGGEKGAVEPVASPGGTKVTVANLFYNTPARMKFLRSAAAEFAAITQTVSQLILACPHIAFKLSHNGKSVLNAPGTGDLRDAVACLAGTDIADALLECNLSRGGYSLHGYIADPKFHRGNRSMQFFTVNGRPVNVPLIASAVEKAFHTLLPVRRFPLAFLNIRVPNDLVDVNVHPAKREVKFTDGNAVFHLVYSACLQALQGMTQWTFSGREGEPVSAPVPQRAEAQAFATYSRPRQEDGYIQEALELPSVTAADGLGNMEILGQVFSTYVVIATDRELRLLDQHAAQERVLYEKYLQSLREGQRPSQVVVPVETPVSGRMRQFLAVHLHRLAELGFKIELMDEAMIIREVPILFKAVLTPRDVNEILETLEDAQGAGYNLSDYSQAAMMLLACKGAVKANQRLSRAEVRQLLLDLDRCQNSRTCPHGRPIWIAFDRADLEKMFARR